MSNAFGQWLVGQRKRPDWVGNLAGMAAKDPAFPADGSADDIRIHLSRCEAEPDVFEALDQAEIEWLAAA